MLGDGASSEKNKKIFAHVKPSWPRRACAAQALWMLGWLKKTIQTMLCQGMLCRGNYGFFLHSLAQALWMLGWVKKPYKPCWASGA